MYAPFDYNNIDYFDVTEFGCVGNYGGQFNFGLCKTVNIRARKIKVTTDQTSPYFEYGASAITFGQVSLVVFDQNSNNNYAVPFVSESEIFIDFGEEIFIQSVCWVLPQTYIELNEDGMNGAGCVYLKNRIYGEYIPNYGYSYTDKDPIISVEKIE